MRLKEDSNSYRASGIKRRDSRHQKPADRHLPVAGKKDTKRWCGGKVGREHKLVCMDKKFGYTLSMKVLACSVCGRELEHWYPNLGEFFRGPKPDWVTE